MQRNPHLQRQLLKTKQAKPRVWTLIHYQRLTISMLKMVC